MLGGKKDSKILKLPPVRNCFTLAMTSETWSLILREKRKLRVFENKVLRRIFGPRRGEITGGMEEIA